MPSPRIIVLNAAMADVRAADLPTLLELADLKFRWERNRYTSREERPCVAFAFVSDEPMEMDNLSHDEMARRLAFDIIVDLKIDTEATAEAESDLGTAAEFYDPSGLAALSWVLDNVMLVLRRSMIDEFRETTALGQVADWVEDVSIDEDEELPDDDGRLVGRANVIYRTSSWDPTLLLMRE
jgi:hypothetical protein